jgi:hypothetical protein
MLRTAAMSEMKQLSRGAHINPQAIGGLTPRA